MHLLPILFLLEKVLEVSYGHFMLILENQNHCLLRFNHLNINNTIHPTESNKNLGTHNSNSLLIIEIQNILKILDSYNHTFLFLDFFHKFQMLLGQGCDSVS